MEPRKSRSEWTRLVAAYERHGGDQRAFVESHGVNLESFRSWLYRLRRERTAESPRLLPVHITPGPAGGAFIEVGVAGVVLRVPLDVSPELAARWVVCLEQRRC